MGKNFNFFFNFASYFFVYIFINFAASNARNVENATFFDEHPSDITMLHSENQNFVAYRNAAKRECYVEPLTFSGAGQTQHSKTLFVGNVKITSSHTMYAKLGDDVINFCKGFAIFTLEERNPFPKSSSKKNRHAVRERRQVALPKNTYFKGQTQTQFISFDDDDNNNNNNNGSGKNEKGGIAEAVAEHDKSRATVQGRIGMGQAQSQSGNGDACAECVASGGISSLGATTTSFSPQSTKLGVDGIAYPQQGVATSQTYPNQLTRTTPDGGRSFYSPQVGQTSPTSGSSYPQQGFPTTQTSYPGRGFYTTHGDRESYPLPGFPTTQGGSTGEGVRYPQQGFPITQPGTGDGSLSLGTTYPRQGFPTTQVGSTGTGANYPTQWVPTTQGGSGGFGPGDGANYPPQGLPTTQSGSTGIGVSYPGRGLPTTQSGGGGGGGGGGAGPTGGASYPTQGFPTTQGGSPNLGASYPGQGLSTTEGGKGTGSFGPNNGASYPYPPQGFPTSQGGETGYPDRGFLTAQGGNTGTGASYSGQGLPTTTQSGGGDTKLSGGTSYPSPQGFPTTRFLTTQGGGSGGLRVGYPEQGLPTPQGSNSGFGPPGGTNYPLQGFPISQSRTNYFPQEFPPTQGGNLGGGGVSYPERGFPITQGGNSGDGSGGGTSYSPHGSPTIQGGSNPIIGGGYPQQGFPTTQGGSGGSGTGTNGETAFPQQVYPTGQGGSIGSGGGASYPSQGFPTAQGGGGGGVPIAQGGSGSGSATSPSYFPQGFPTNHGDNQAVGGISGGASYPQPQQRLLITDGGSTGSADVGGGTSYPQPRYPATPGGVVESGMAGYPPRGYPISYPQQGFPAGQQAASQNGVGAAGSTTYPQQSGYGSPGRGASTTIPSGIVQTSPPRVDLAFPRQGIYNGPGGAAVPQTGVTANYPTAGFTPQWGGGYYPTNQGTLPGAPTSTLNEGQIQGGAKGVDVSQGSQIIPVDTLGGESQSLSTLNIIGNDTKAAASAQGKTRNGMAQAQVSGTYSGSFSAQAQTSDNEKSVESQIFGNSTGASSSSQGRAGKSQSQSQIQYSYKTGATVAEAQGGGVNYGTNTQIQAGNKGGIADAQSTGTGSTSSQAQIGFLPLDPKRNEHNSLFQGGGTSSSQNSASSGQSQTQLEGSFRFGPSFVGSAQSSAGRSLNTTKLAFNSTNLSNFNLIDRQDLKQETATFEKLISQSKKSIADKTNNEDDDNDNEDNDENNRSKNKNNGDNNVLKSTVPLSLLPQNDEEEFKLKSKKQINADPSQDQNALVKSEKFDAFIYRDSSNVKVPPPPPPPPSSSFLHSGEIVPGTSDYRIPNGFRGKIASKAGDITQAIASSTGQAQTQTVILKPGTGRVTINDRNKSKQPQQQYYIQNDSVIEDKNKNPFNQYITVTKSETGEINNGDKKYSHTYYTKSSTCGYFTFTCNLVDGSKGRTKICKPGPLTYSDGTPC